MDGYTLPGKFTPKFFYIKRNKTSGVLYVGQTIQNPVKYLGTGAYWKSHCKKHGGRVQGNIENLEVFFAATLSAGMEWLWETETWFPKYWLRDDFGNQSPEVPWDNSMAGNKHSPVTKSRISAAWDPDLREKRSAAAKVVWADPDLREKQLAAQKEYWSTPEARAKNSTAQKEYWSTPKARAKNSAAQKAAWADLDLREKQSASLKAYWARRKAAGWVPKSERAGSQA